jgi:hypothetical protein
MQTQHTSSTNLEKVPAAAIRLTQTQIIVAIGDKNQL